MKLTKPMLICVLLIVLLFLAAVWRWWPSKGRFENANIDLYIKIICQQ